nr:DinI-like family protein [Yersinia pekkanenii]
MTCDANGFRYNAESFPVGYTNALTSELTNHLRRKFTDIHVKVRFVGADGLTMLGGMPDNRDVIQEILPETWESVDNWFQPLSSVSFATNFQNVDHYNRLEYHA